MKAWGVFLVYYTAAGYKSETRVSAPNRERAHADVAAWPGVLAVTHSIVVKHPEGEVVS